MLISVLQTRTISVCEKLGVTNWHRAVGLRGYIFTTATSFAKYSATYSIFLTLYRKRLFNFLYTFFNYLYKKNKIALLIDQGQSIMSKNSFIIEWKNCVNIEKSRAPRAKAGTV